VARTYVSRCMCAKASLAGVRKAAGCSQRTAQGFSLFYDKMCLLAACIKFMAEKVLRTALGFFAAELLRWLSVYTHSELENCTNFSRAN
jgi:hypothetical protein